MDTVRIDGSIGEGGGQVLRTAAGLAARTGLRLEIDNVRQGRDKPGLRPQHVAALEAVRQACEGELKGATVGASAVELVPGGPPGGTVQVDAGTAGNTLLILQALLPLAPGLEEPLLLEARGGTDTKWAPTLGFLRDVLVPLLARAGVELELLEAHEGFYPKGGGHLRVRIHPRRGSRWPGVLEQRGSLEEVEVSVRLCQLPDHVGERVAASCVERLAAGGCTAEATVERVESRSPGVVVDAVARFEHTVLGANALGEKGVPSETVGTGCAEALIAELESLATVDVHAADQVVPLVYDLAGAGYVAREATGHLRTNLAVVGRFLAGGSVVEELSEGVRVRFG